MRFAEMLRLITWDLKINRGASWDSLRAMGLVVEIRLEQFVYSWTHDKPGLLKPVVWLLVRGLGSVWQWFWCSSNIPGSTRIGRGLRLPHPQNIIVAGYAEIGEFCTVYQNVSIAWNGFEPVRPGAPKIGNRVLLGAGVIVVGDVVIGSEVLVGAGTVVAGSVPDHSRVTSVKAEVAARHACDMAVQPGSQRHIEDPYGIWR